MENKERRRRPSEEEQMRARKKRSATSSTSHTSSTTNTSGTRQRPRRVEGSDALGGNPAKTTSKARRKPDHMDGERRGNSSRNSSRKGNSHGGSNRNKQSQANARHRGRVTLQKKSNIRSKRLGFVLAGIQALLSIVFIVSIMQIGMLPTRYEMVLLVLLLLLDLLLFFVQFFSKKNAIVGKILSILLIILLGVGSFYMIKASSTLLSITGGDVKVDNMVVVVLDSNPAETLEDVADYSFGVQYAMDGDDVEETIATVESKLGTTLDVTEYSDMQAIALALQTGEVQAIIYNDAHSSFIEDENESFATDIKIIYTYGIETALSLNDSAAANIEVKDECFIVYISGIDVYGNITTNSRSDVNMLAVVNPNTHEILLVNTPRDYYVSFPGVTGDSKDKLTHAGIYGVDTSMATLEALYDIDIDFYARVNFTSLIEMVDALGGISVYSEYSFTTIEHAGLYKLTVNEGYNDFDGTDALIFARERYNVPGGDNQRGINQQEVIKAMIEKVCSPSIITGAYGLLESLSGNVDTNMSTSQIQDLIKQQLDENIAWNIETVSATGTGSSEYCYSYSGGKLYVTIPDYDVVDEISVQIESVLNGGTINDAETDTATEE